MCMSQQGLKKLLEVREVHYLAQDAWVGRQRSAADHYICILSLIRMPLSKLPIMLETNLGVVCFESLKWILLWG